MATFILVHGTFAKSAEWPDLQRSLVDTAASFGTPANFEQVLWTGKNRASARQDAADQIAETVTRVKSRSPAERVFLIGHSHGGSAIAYFLKRHTQLLSLLSGCAFLSTPFVAIRRRREPWALMYFVYYVFIFAVAISVPVDFLLNFEVLLAAAVIGLVLIVPPWLRKRLSGHVDRLAERTTLQQTADLPPGNFLFLRSSGDEAAITLAAAQFIGWLSTKVHRSLSLLLGPLNSSRQFVRIAYGSFLVLFMLFFSPLSFELIANVTSDPEGIVGSLKGMIGYIFTQEILLMVLGVTAFVVVVLTMLLMLIFITGAIVILLAQAITLWVFGWTRFSIGFFVELAIEPLPFGEHKLTHIDWGQEFADSEDMSHSWTYAHPAAIRRLQEWVHDALSKPAFQPHTSQSSKQVMSLT